MSYYIIDLAFHVLICIACAGTSVLGFCAEVWLSAILNLLVTIGSGYLVFLDIKEIKTELWWNKQIKLKQSFIDYNDEEDYEQI